MKTEEAKKLSFEVAMIKNIKDTIANAQMADKTYVFITVPPEKMAVIMEYFRREDYTVVPTEPNRLFIGQ